MRLDLAEHERTPLSETEKDAIREQMSRLLESPFFRQSKRLPKILRYVIDQTLAGDVDSIKERTLGVEIFGRNADYETATDPIVRVTAAEVRKRVAQYYLELGHEDELRITIPSGSYIPQFYWPESANKIGSRATTDPLDAEDKDPLADEPEATFNISTPHYVAKLRGVVLESVSDGPPLDPEDNSEPKFAHPRRRHFLVMTMVSLLAAGLLSAATVLIWRSIHHSSFDFFWGPVTNSSDPVLICVADEMQDTGVSLRDTNDPSRSRWFPDTEKKNSFPTVAIDNVNVMVKLGAILQSSGKLYTVKGEGITNMADLRSGPAIFVGAFDNAWTLRLANPLRFRFANDPDMGFPRIVDSTDPTKPGWVSDQSRMGSVGNYRDYAIIARFTDSDTGKLVIIVAGIGRCGSLAAGQFLSDASDLANLERAARAAGNKKNMELVLSTEVIDGQPGSPKVEAAHFW